MVNIVKISKEYFSENIEKRLYDEQECKAINQEYIQYLQSIFEDTFILSNIVQLKRLIIAYFYNIAEVDFEIDLERQIFFTLRDSDAKPKYEKFLRPVVNILSENQNLIHYPYHGRDDQIAITKDLAHLIDDEISEFLEVDERKKLIRSATRRALDLCERDIILFLKDKIIIKIFQKVESLNPQAAEPKQRNIDEYRFFGYDYTELENYYSEFFKEFTIDEFLEEVTISLVNNELDFSVINNTFFERYALSIINSKVCATLEKYIEEKSDFILGFGGFVFRKHFIKIYESLAKELLQKVVDSDPNAKSFLGYYNGETIILSGKKYLLPSITNSYGEMWNISSAIVSSKAWFNADRAMQNGQIKLLQAQKKLRSLEKTLKLTEKRFDMATNQNEAKKEELAQTKKELISAISTLQSNQSDHDEDLKNSIKKLSAAEQQLQRDIKLDEQTLRQIQKELAQVYEDVKLQKKQVDDANSELANTKALHKDTLRKYDEFIQALIKALTTKKCEVV
jgi:hypothetical protein